VEQGDRVNDRFDAMIAKLVVWAPDRAGAVARLQEALEAFRILGTPTNLPLLQAISRSPEYLAGRYATGWIAEHLDRLNGPLLPEPWMTFFTGPDFRAALASALAGCGQPANEISERFMAQPALRPGSSLERPAFRLQAAGAGAGWRLTGPVLAALRAARPGPPPAQCGPGLRRALDGEAPLLNACRLDAGRLAVAVFGETLILDDPMARLPSSQPSRPAPELLVAPMAGKVLEVHARPGALVAPGELLFVMESMKMQFEIRAPGPGLVAEVLVTPGQVLPGPGPLARMEPAAGPAAEPTPSGSARPPAHPGNPDPAHPGRR
jgi:biotin carboxyl carrier protein